MGKHEAPVPETRSARRHAAAAEKKKLDLHLPEVKMPEIKLPELHMPAFHKPDLSSIGAFFDKLSRYGAAEGSRSRKRTYSFSREQVFLTGVGALLFFLLWLLSTTGWLRFILYLIPFFVLGLYTLQDALGEIMDREIPGRSLLVSFASIGFICLRQPHAAIFIMLIHRVLLMMESYLFEKKESSLEKLEELIPSSAVTESEDGLERVAPRDVSVGDILFVPTGDVIALDGIVTEGISSLDTSALSGANTNCDVGINSRVCAGCRNLTNPLKIQVTAPFEESLVCRMVARARQAARTEPSRADILQLILSYVPAALAVVGLILAVVVSLVTKQWSTWIYRGLLLIALAGCGDSLIASRAAYFTGVLDTAREGILFRDSDVIDRLAGSDMMIFSKTGTITEGKYSVVGVYPVGYEEKDLLTIAALSECQSEHPIAKALRDACGIDIHHRSDITLLEDTPGRGIHTLFGGRNVYVGNSTLLLDHNIVFDVPSHKGTVIHVAVDNKYAGCIVLSDRVREGAFDAVEELRLRGIRSMVMLTGDVRSMARPIASSLGFDMVKCELSNESKLEALEYLRESKGNNAAISYVSSKAEDLELLGQADVGIAFHVMNETSPMEDASLQIMGSNIFQIPQAMYYAKRISFAALLDAAIALGLLLLLVVLGISGVTSVWFSLLLILIARIGTLVYSIYFK